MLRVCWLALAGSGTLIEHGEAVGRLDVSVECPVRKNRYLGKSYEAANMHVVEAGYLYDPPVLFVSSLTSRRRPYASLL